MTDTQENAATGAPETPPPKKPPKEKEAATGPRVVKLKDILLPEDWNREKLTKISELAQSIKDIGLTSALTVLLSKEHPGKYILRDGRRRYAALHEAKIAEAPVNVLPEMDETKARLVSIAANENREENNPYEKALTFESLAADGVKNRDIAKACGKTEGYVSQHRAILRTPDYVQKAIRAGHLPASATRILVKLNYEEDQAFYDKVAEAMIAGTMNLEDAAEKIDYHLSQKEAKESGGKGKGKKSAAKTKAEKRRGPTVRIPDYADKEVIKQMEALPKTEANKYLVHFADKLSKTISKVKSAYNQGVLHGIEISYKLRGE
jgi:ParB/RepB/Spo0J family partition protein